MWRGIRVDATVTRLLCSRSRQLVSYFVRIILHQASRRIHWMGICPKPKEAKIAFNHLEGNISIPIDIPPSISAIPNRNQHGQYPRLYPRLPKYNLRSQLTYTGVDHKSHRLRLLMSKTSPPAAKATRPHLSVSTTAFLPRCSALPTTQCQY